MSSLFTVHFLGTSSGLPTTQRNVSCVALQFGKKLFLLDCGEGAQLSLLRGGFNLSSISGIFITHVHGDHCFGLPGLVSTLWLMGRPLPPLISTQGVLDYAMGVNQLTVGEKSQQPMVSVESIDPDTPVFEGQYGGGYQLRVFAAPLDHRVISYGFRVEVSRTHPAKVLKAKLLADGIRPGPIYGRLQRGEDVILDDGRVLKSVDYCEGPRIERGSFVYLTDTRHCQASIDLAQGADLICHEATFITGQEARAKDLGHSTVLEAVDIWQKSDGKRLVLTHFSARHKMADYRQILKDAGVLEQVILAEDGMAIEV